MTAKKQKSHKENWVEVTIGLKVQLRRCTNRKFIKSILSLIREWLQGTMVADIQESTQHVNQLRGHHKRSRMRYL